MRNGQRLFTYVVASFAVLAFGWALLIGGVYLFGGIATVSIVEHNEGVSVKLPIPMALVHAAAATTEIFFLDDLLDEIEIETHGEFSRIAPLALEMLEVLDDVPNGTVFVEVQDGEDHVRVSKVGGKFRVEVESPDVSVKVGVPTRAVKRTVARLVR